MVRLVKASAIACAGMLLACGGGGGDTAEGAEPTSNQVTIVFENNQFADATVYYHGGAGQRRLGRVSGSSTGRFRAPHSPSGFRIMASFQAIGDFETPMILADPGNVVTVSSQSTGNLIFSISN
jgi:hypothetical protein